MTDIDKIIEVKDKLRDKLKWNEWYRGMRITTNNGKFLIKVIVSDITDEVRKITPSSFEGFNIVLNEFTKEEFQGEI